MLSRILDAWRDVTSIRAEADIEVAEIEARTKRYVARVAAGHIRPPEQPDPEVEDEDLRRVVQWAESQYGDSPIADDIIGMWRMTRRGTPTPGVRSDYEKRLRDLGLPSDW